MLPLTRLVLMVMAIVCVAMVLVGGMCASGAAVCHRLLGVEDAVVGTPLIVLGSVALGAPMLAIGGAVLVGAVAALLGLGGRRDTAVEDSAKASAEAPLLPGGHSLNHTSQATSQALPRSPPPKVLAEIRSFIYASHFLSAWGDRMWQFAVPLLFMEIFVDTLLPSALFSLLLYLGCTLCMTAAGRWVDRAPRMLVVARSIFIDNLCILLSTALLCAMLARSDSERRWTWDGPNIALFVAINALGTVAEVMNQVQTLALERDWVVVVAGRSSAMLAEMNRIMRRVDLLCKILAPITFGFLMQFSGGTPQARALVGAGMVGLWNLLSWPLEWVLARDVYASHALLRVPKAPNAHPQADATSAEEPAQNPVASTAVDPAGGVSSAGNGGAKVVGGVLPAWRLYMQHRVFLASVAYSALYMTVLDNGTLMTAYLVWRGVPQSAVGLQRGVGACFGMAGTFLFPHIQRWSGSLTRAGLVSIWLFFFSLLPCMLAFLVLGEDVASDYSLIGCMILSRAGLWAFDLSLTQIMQEWTEEHHRGLLNGMQTASYQMFFVIMQALGMVVHNPKDFGVLVVYSIGSVGAAACLYTLWSRRPATRQFERELQAEKAQKAQIQVQSKYGSSG